MENNNHKKAPAPQPTPAKWDASISQSEYMERDTVLVVDPQDNVIGSASKYASHVFSSETPRGVLHRAFSVFLFETSPSPSPAGNESRLLLQKRAASKITFPNVWTNTCCSHPLHGMVPLEVDVPMDVTTGEVTGVKYAAIRKLGQELGIQADELKVEEFKFLTRLHYWAADTITHGKRSPWGEHEIDYVLFLTIPSRSRITLNPHPEEVDDVKWVTQSELLDMFQDETLLFSPWFRIIAHKWLVGVSGGGGVAGVERLTKGAGWWDDLHRTMTTNDFCDYGTIHRFDPPVEHMGGDGDAGPMFVKNYSVDEYTAGEEKKSEDFGVEGGQRKEVTISEIDAVTVGDSSKKQGAYGKVRTHTESKFSQLMHMDEIWSAVTLLHLRPLQSNLQSSRIQSTFDANNLAFCDDILCKVSRSFASVIRQLPDEMLVDVLIFYLVLRALDTVEDDMTYFSTPDAKIAALLSFHKSALVDPAWRMMGCGSGDERRLLEEFPRCHSIYTCLPDSSRRVIADITCRMATGMAEFVTKDLGQGTIDVAQYNRYCHFVAGLVGEGLSRLFVSSGLERPSLVGCELLHLSDQMGLFLQKTNIIRDYLEDYVDGRAFWPRSVWTKYSATGDLGYFANPSVDGAKVSGLNCLNELITDALELVPDCLAYLSELRCAEVFRFCAIPQVMAIATLDKCYQNADVFTGVVKIRKGMSCLLINNTTDMAGVHGIFHRFSRSIMHKAMDARSLGGYIDPSYNKTVRACQTIMELTQTEASAVASSSLNDTLIVASCAAATAATCVALKVSSGSSTKGNVAVTTSAIALASFGMLTVLKSGFMKKYWGGMSRPVSLLPAAKLKDDLFSLSANK